MKKLIKGYRYKVVRTTGYISKYTGNLLPSQKRGFVHVFRENDDGTIASVGRRPTVAEAKQLSFDDRADRERKRSAGVV